MRIKVNLVFNNRFNNKSKGELQSEAHYKVGRIISILSKDGKIKISQPIFRYFFWNKDDYSKGDFDKSFDGYRVSFIITKYGRSKYSERDIYAIVNRIHISYFSKI